MQDDPSRISSPSSGIIESMRRRNRLALRPASWLLVTATYFIVLAAVFGLLYLFDIASNSSVLIAFIASGILAIPLAALIERTLRRWFFL